MKKSYLYILILISLNSCKKTIFNCRLSGEKITEHIDLRLFDTIEVNPLIKLKITDDANNSIDIKADKEVMPNITYKIVNHKLILTNNTYCTIENNEAVAEISLKANNISTIIANTDKAIYSGNILHYNNLTLISENANIGNNNIADFNLQIQTDTLKIFANGSSIFNIQGSSQYVFVGFYGVNPTFNGKNLQADNIKFYQRSSGDMHLNPLQKITGNLLGYGDVYLYHKPNVINIIKHNRGQVYFVN